MASSRIRSLAAVAGRVLPEIRKPIRKVSFTEKMFWTAFIVLLYLIMSEIPLYGVAGGQTDPFALLRVIFASRRGTLMELGIGPIVTAGLVLQLLKGSKMLNIDTSKPEDRKLYSSLNKLLAIGFTGFEAAAFIIGGAYGLITEEVAILIFGQLLAVGVMVILMDELIQKGWGFGSGISLFIAAGVAQTIFWRSLSPIPAQDGLFVGALLALSQAVSSNTITSVLFRPAGLPTLIGFASTIAIFTVIVYLEGMRVEIPVAHAKFRGFRGTYPVKLFYVSNIPVILASALFADVYFASSLMWNRAADTPLAAFLGSFDVDGNPISGLTYYLTPPRSIQGVAADPLRAGVYLILFVAVCIGFAWTWVSIAGLSASNVAKQLIDAGMQVPGFRRSESSIRDVLNRYIPAVTIIGGALVGLIAAVADFFSSFGTGTGILLMTSIIWQYYQLLAKERIEEMYPGLGKLLGR
ncbi:MAG: preprotein translocase subunit SecY [Candidatus Bathyarchaeia archaeon]